MMGKLVLKQVVTESYKEKTRGEFQEAIEKVEAELAQFDKDMQKTIMELTLKGHPQLEQLRRQFNGEREKISVYKDQLLLSIDEIAHLPVGAVVEAGEGNFLQTIKVGDHFATSTVCEVILQDDVVVEINQ